MRLVYKFRGLVCYHHGWKHGSMQADIVLEKEIEELFIQTNRQQKETVSLDIA